MTVLDSEAWMKMEMVVAMTMMRVTTTTTTDNKMHQLLTDILFLSLLKSRMARSSYISCQDSMAVLGQ